MLKFNLAGSVQEELEKIALDKGWIKMAEEPVDSGGSSPSGYSADAQKAKIQSLDVSGLQTMLNKFMQEYSKKSGLNYPFKLDANGIWDSETAEVWNMVSKILGNKLQQSGPESTPSSGQINGAIGLMIKTLKGEGVDLAGGAKAAPSIGKATEQSKEWASNVPAPHSMTDATKGLYQTAPKAVMPKALSREERIRDFMNTHPSFTQEQAEAEINRIDYNKRQGSNKSNLSKRADLDLMGDMVDKIENDASRYNPLLGGNKKPTTPSKPPAVNPGPFVGPQQSYWDPNPNPGSQSWNPKVPAVPTAAPASPVAPTATKTQSAVHAKDPLVMKVQEKLQANKYNVGPSGADGRWGQKTQKAWDLLLQNAKKLGYNVISVEGKRPSKQELQYFYANGVPGYKPEAPAAPAAAKPQRELDRDWDSLQADDPEFSQNADPGKKNEEAMMLAAKGMPAHKALENVASKTINELISLASELEEIGEVKAAIAVDNQINFYKQAMDKLYDVTGETGEKFIGDSHKDHVCIAPAKEEGGKVENVVEQQKKDLEVATKEPTGKYAKTIMELIATASQLEEAGEIEAAERVDRAIYELQGKLPFANKKLGVEATSFHLMKKNASLENDLGLLINKFKLFKTRIDSYVGFFSDNIEGESLNSQFDEAISTLESCKGLKEDQIFGKLSGVYNGFYEMSQGGSYYDGWRYGLNIVKTILAPATLGISVAFNFFVEYDRFEAALGMEDARKFGNFMNEQFKPILDKYAKKAGGKIEENDPNIQRKRNDLKGTLKRVINIIDDAKNNNILSKLVNPDIISRVRSYLVQEISKADSLNSIRQIDVENSTLWNIRNILAKNGLDLSAEFKNAQAESLPKQNASLNLRHAAEQGNTSELEKAFLQLLDGASVDKNKPQAAPGKAKETGGGGTQRGVPFNRNLHKDTVLGVQNNINRIFKRKEGEDTYLKADKMYGPITHTSLVWLLRGSNVQLGDSYANVSQDQLQTALAVIAKMPNNSIDPPPVDSAKKGDMTPTSPAGPAAAPAQIATQPGQAPATPMAPVAPGQGEKSPTEQAKFDATLKNIDRIYAKLKALWDNGILLSSSAFSGYFTGVDSYPSEQLALLLNELNFAQNNLIMLEDSGGLKGRIIGQRGLEWHTQITYEFKQFAIALNKLKSRIPIGNTSRLIPEEDRAGTQPAGGASKAEAQKINPATPEQTKSSVKKTIQEAERLMNLYPDTRDKSYLGKIEKDIQDLKVRLDEGNLDINRYKELKNKYDNFLAYINAHGY